MGGLSISRCQRLWTALQFFVLIQATIICCYQYKVGDLGAWNLPSSANPDVYVKWSKYHVFKLGDSLFFLYPPSQDSVLQVTPQAFKSCNLKDPILRMNDGNSLYNITIPGEFYFISGAQGHCEKSQKLHISLPGNGSYVYPPAYGPSPDADSPSYPTVFGGPIPSLNSSSSSSSSSSFTITSRINPVFLSAVIVFIMLVMASGSS